MAACRHRSGPYRLRYSTRADSATTVVPEELRGRVDVAVDASHREFRYRSRNGTICVSVVANGSFTITQDNSATTGRMLRYALHG